MTDPKDIFIAEADFRKRYKYSPDDLLGEGGFAQVYKAFDRQFEEFVALKFYNKGKQGKYDVLHEMKDSRSYSHKNIIRVHDARIAALCLAHGVRELWTADRDFSRFAKLATANPLAV